MSPIAAVLPALPALPSLLAAVTPGPTPVPQPVEQTGPGIVGFLVTFALVLVCIPLFLSMTRRIRGVGYRDAASSEQGGAIDAPGGRRGHVADRAEGAGDAGAADAADAVGDGPADRTGPDVGTPQP